mgnify:CR=1 FL=1
MVEVIDDISDVAKEKLSEAVQVYCLLSHKRDTRSPVLEVYDKARFRNEEAGVEARYGESGGYEVETFNAQTVEDATEEAMERVGEATLIVRAKTAWSCVECGADVFPRMVMCEKCDREWEKRQGLQVAAPRVI